MADYVVNLSGTAQVDNSIVQEFAQQVLITHGEMGIADQFVSLRTEIGASSVSMPIYDRLSINTSPLNEREDVASKALSDRGVLITPKEYGDVITKTSLASLQTGGKVDLAAAQLVGINMAQTQNKLALLAADASTNVLFGGDATATNEVALGDILTGNLANAAYNKLSRETVPGLPAANGAYIAIAHDDVLNDIRSSAGFEEMKKFQDAEGLSRNIIGFYKGFFWVRDNLSTVAAVGASGAKVYNTYYMGFNGLGKGTSLAPQLRVTGPFDKLARFVNIGWYGVFDYKIIQPEALWVSKTTATLGV